MSENQVNKDLKAWIDNATYSQLLSKWRHTPLTENTLFHGETGKYYSKVMNEKKKALTNEQQVQISKNIGW